MQQKQQSQSSTVKSDGQRLIENLSAYFTAVSSHLGMFQRSDQQEQLLKRLEEELAALNLSLTSSSLQSKCSKKLQDANLVVLNAMISAAKSLRLWLSEESDAQPSSASATSRTTDSVEQSTDSGGQMNHSAA
jgi:hypothetical protein